ncbi:glycosyltransferase family 4 protein [Flavobacterium adhaerens]|uniref:glycosyltransferase family 4 protein n=1 Tax=Flavobacterium adhaerens TaxID=3149043 RepID=UPI0032B5C2E3
MKRKKLVIISHTEHYRNADGIIKGWGATVNEIDYLSQYWDEVCHVACLYDTSPPASSLPYLSNNIEFVPIPSYGGKRIIDKIFILFKIPKIIYQTIKTIKGATEVQLRLPTSMGLFLLPLFSFFIPRKFTFWVKYAGNWKQEKAPLSYRLQRWWLQKNIAKCAVTINGFWEDQPKHCHSFENPCLADLDIQNGKEVALSKTFQVPFVFSFVGRLEKAKGMDRIVEALKEMEIDTIAKVHFVGNGPLEKEYKEMMSFLGDKAVFHGFLGKEKVHEILKTSHFFLLPSDSEGFPKVVAEAACYGVIPIVSNVGSIPHYVNESNGFLWDIKNEISYSSVLQNTIAVSSESLNMKSNNILKLAEKFTFANYKNKLLQILPYQN